MASRERVPLNEMLALSAPQAARLVGCRLESIYQAMRRGELGYFNTGEVGKRIPRAELDRWLRRKASQDSGVG